MPEELKGPARALYTRIADICGEELGERGYCPHEHSDPHAHETLTPAEVYAIDARQVGEFCNLLIVVAIAPSWGGGMEVEIAHQNQVPILILKPKNKKVSRCMLGNPSVREVIEYSDAKEAEELTRTAIRRILTVFPTPTMSR